MSLGLILGTNGDPTQMMDSREQLHVDGQRQAFLESPGRARRHSNTDSSAHVQLFTGGFMMGGRGTRLWGALLRRAVRCGAVRFQHARWWKEEKCRTDSPPGVSQSNRSSVHSH